MVYNQQLRDIQRPPSCQELRQGAHLSQVPSCLEHFWYHLHRICESEISLTHSLPAFRASSPREVPGAAPSGSWQAIIHYNMLRNPYLSHTDFLLNSNFFGLLIKTTVKLKYQIAFLISISLYSLTIAQRFSSIVNTWDLTACYKACMWNPSSTQRWYCEVTGAHQLVINSYSVRKGLGEGNGTPLQYSCLENPMDGGAW